MAISNNMLLSETRYKHSRDVRELFPDEHQTQAMLLPYKYALDFILNLLEGVKIEYSRTGLPSPIRRIDSRIKTAESITEKLSRRNLPLVSQSLQELTDIAGARVICHHVDDVYWITDYLLAREEVTLLRESDYIESPKSNGYRSLHLILEAEVSVFGEIRQVPIEVQIRTTAMDFWAGIEHQVKYKANRNVPEEIRQQLKECAEVINSVDIRMQEVSRSLNELDLMSEYDRYGVMDLYTFWE